MSSERKPVKSQVVEELAHLPVPDMDAQAHSEKLIQLIRDEIIQAGGKISFARYMELALFAPGLGYYSAGSRKFGESGDFITAPEISSLFSRTLAQQLAEVLQIIGGGDVLEVGGGSGVMAADMLAELESLEILPTSYAILELSADLRERQRGTLAKRVPHLLNRVQWLEELPEPGFRGVVVANELLDALPVHCFSMEGDGVKERFVTWENNRFQWQKGEPEADFTAEKIEALLTVLTIKNLPVGYESEINLVAGAWISSIAEMLESGVVLLLDYGFPRNEYYHPQRTTGTLMCHYRHRAHDDPFVYPGLQDITAHVDFTAIAEAAVASGLEVSGYTSQAYFLLSNGLTELAETTAGNEQEQILSAQQIRTLTMPGEMGELFKVMALSKAYENSLRGFAMQDIRYKL